MDVRFQRIASLNNVEANEKIPLAQRNLAKNTYDVFQSNAERYPNKIALRFLFAGMTDEEPLNYSYHDLFTNITQTANAFQTLGINKKDVISILLPNIPQNHFALWGAEACGIANPINPLLEAAHIIAIMNATRAKVLVTLTPTSNANNWERIQQIAEQVSSLETILTINLAQFYPPEKAPISMLTPAMMGKCKVINFDEYIAQQSAKELGSNVEHAWDDPACYFHTGGTTGMPKVAVHTHGNQIFSAWMVGQQLAWDETDVMHCGLPLFHVNAPLITGLAPFMVGGEVILTSPQGFRSPVVLNHFWQLIEKYNISFFMGVPAVYVELNKRWKGDTDISSLKFAACGAAPMPTALMTEFTQRTRIPILEGYGLTEGTVFSSVNPPFGEKRVGSIGIRIPYQDMRAVILNDQNEFVRDCEINEIGTIVIRGPNVFKGYLQNNENNIWVDGAWLNTGDLGQQQSDGYFKLSGRSKDLIIRGGHNIDPQLIEEALSQHPAVALVAAIGKPDVRLGELPVAYVMLREGQYATNAELREFAAEHINEHAAAPVEVYITDAIPLTSVGKIYKPALRVDAIKRTFAEALESFTMQGIKFSISIKHDAAHGQKAIVILDDDTSHEKISEIRQELKGFSVATEVKIAAL